jgi:hypothetical protein
MVVDVNGVQKGSLQRTLQDWTHWENNYIANGYVELVNYCSKYNNIATVSSAILKKDVFFKMSYHLKNKSLVKTCWK